MVGTVIIQIHKYGRAKPDLAPETFCRAEGEGWISKQTAIELFHGDILSWQFVGEKNTFIYIAWDPSQRNSKRKAAATTIDDFCTVKPILSIF